MKLSWQKCSCSSPHCKLEYPANIGQFYQGTGFRPVEKLLLDTAFSWINSSTVIEEAIVDLIEDFHEPEAFFEQYVLSGDRPILANVPQDKFPRVYEDLVAEIAKRKRVP